MVRSGGFADRRPFVPFRPMTTRRTLMAAAATAVVALSACGSGSSKAKQAESFADPAALSRALNRAGAGCSDYQREDSPEYSADQEGTCHLGSESLTLDTFKDAGQLKNWEGSARALGCSAGKAFGISTINYVRGNDWTVSTSSKSTADDVAGKMSAKSVTISCA